jgi:hypothetical protein
MQSRPDRKHHLPPCSQLHGLDGLVLTPIGDGGEDLFAMARMLRWSPPLGRLPGAEVVAAAGEAARCRGGCLCWRAARS